MNASPLNESNRDIKQDNSNSDKYYNHAFEVDNSNNIGLEHHIESEIPNNCITSENINDLTDQFSDMSCTISFNHEIMYTPQGLKKICMILLRVLFYQL